MQLRQLLVSVALVARVCPRHERLLDPSDVAWRHSLTQHLAGLESARLGKQAKRVAKPNVSDERGRTLAHSGALNLTVRGP
jgi:hypothetical protein